MLQETIQAAVAPRESVWGPSVRLLTFGLTLVVSAAAFEALAVAATMPATTAELGGLELYGWAFSAFTLTNLIGVTVAGGEADRRGPATPLLVGIGLFVLGLLAGGMAPSMPVLIAARALQGFGAGFISSVAYIAIGRGYPEAAKAHMLAILSSAWVIPGLLGPAAAGWIAEHIGWRWVFLGLAPLPLLGAAMTWPALRHLGRAGEAPRDWRRIRDAILLAAGAGALMAGLSGPSLLPALGLIAGGAAVGLPALRRLMPPGTLRAAPGLPATIATALLLNLSFFGVDAFIPLALTSARGLSPVLAGLALTAATLTWTGGAWVQAHFAPRAGRRQLTALGLIVLVLGTAGVAMATLPSVPALVAPLAWGLAGLGMGIAYSTVSLTVLELAPKGAEGSATSAMQLANMIGTALGTGVGGAIVAYTASSGISTGAGILAHDALMGAVALAAALAALGMPARPPRAEAAETVVS